MTATERTSGKPKKPAACSGRRGTQRRTGGRGGARARKKTEAASGLMAAVPVKERLEIDKTLIREEPPLTSADAVYDHFELSERYRVDRRAFEEYARRMREVRAMGYADRLARTLLSEEGTGDRESRMDLMTSRLAERIARLLADDEDMSVSELARLASSAASLRRAMTQAEKERIGRAEDDEPAATLSSKVRHAVRELYGLDAPAESARQTWEPT